MRASSKPLCVIGLLIAAAVVLCGCDRSTVTVRITSPEDGAAFEVGQAITFSGTASDTQDGQLTGEALVWESDIDGQIGTGTEFSRDDLSEGFHLIFLTATNSEGFIDMDAIAITVGDAGWDNETNAGDL